jgi:hypothetical protein
MGHRLCLTDPERLAETTSMVRAAPRAKALRTHEHDISLES